MRRHHRAATPRGQAQIWVMPERIVIVNTTPATKITMIG
jgi:hypothetical protein